MALDNQTMADLVSYIRARKGKSPMKKGWTQAVRGAKPVVPQRAINPNPITGVKLIGGLPYGLPGTTTDPDYIARRREDMKRGRETPVVDPRQRGGQTRVMTDPNGNPIQYTPPPPQPMPFLRGGQTTPMPGMIQGMDPEAFRKAMYDAAVARYRQNPFDKLGHPTAPPNPRDYEPGMPGLRFGGFGRTRY